jgi:hypothetical protein
MELLNSLQRELKERRKDNNAFSEEEIIKLGMDICRALVVCERNNITHRDIKPANVMVSDAGEYKLGDFGTARSFDHSTLATYTGTETYMAPKVYKHQTYIGRKADIYSLGLMLYWLANNYTRPFIDLDRIPTADERAYSEHRRVTGEPLPAPCNAGPALSHVILKACAYRSEDRYETAREMLEDLEKLKKVEAPVAAPASTKDDEIEALKRRLADLIGTTEEIPAAGDTRAEAFNKRNAEVKAAQQEKIAEEKAAEEAKAAEEMKVAEAKAEEKKKANEKFKLKVDGDFGPASIKAVQHILGCKEDGICGTETIKAIQKLVGAEADGVWGTQTSKALQKFLGVTADGVAGPETFKAFQKWANKELGF